MSKNDNMAWFWLSGTLLGDQLGVVLLLLLLPPLL
jgi:hypothetical protein